MKEFAVDFAEKVAKNQGDSLKLIYPAIENADSVSLRCIPDEIVVNDLGKDNEYEVLFNPNVSLIIGIEADDNLSVKNSRGLFVFQPKTIEVLKKEGLWQNELSDIEIIQLIDELNDLRKNFSSPDLNFFNLHGPVKSIVISSDRTDGLDYFYGCQKGSYKFDTKGQWINYKPLSIKRNSKGQIISLKATDWEYDQTSIFRYAWEGDLPASFQYLPQGDFILDQGNFTFTNGNISLEKGKYSRQYDASFQIKYSNFEIDEYGNWTTCHFTTEIPNAYTNLNEIERKSGSIKRIITYYE